MTRANDFGTSGNVSNARAQIQNSSSTRIVFVVHDSLTRTTQRVSKCCWEKYNYTSSTADGVVPIKTLGRGGRETNLLSPYVKQTTWKKTMFACLKRVTYGLIFQSFTMNYSWRLTRLFCKTMSITNNWSRSVLSPLRF